MSPQPFEVLARDAAARLEGVFAVGKYFGRPPGAILIGKFASDGDGPATAESLLAPYGYYVRSTHLENGDWMLEVSPKVLPETKRRLWINILLFVATIGTTLAVGSMNRGGNLLKPADWLLGVPFSAALIGILLCHEMSHFAASRRHRVRATLPFFLPVPHPLLGTFGAFIKMQSPIPNRKALLDIGAAGPIAGFLVALPVTIAGLYLSAVVPKGAMPAGTLILGDSLLFKALTYLVKGPMGVNDVQLHPLALAGWIGLWVTSVNLLPVGQLDGGHVSYALFGKFAIWVARAAFVALVAAGLLWNGWFIWAIFVLLLVRLKHPAPLDDDAPLGLGRQVVGWLIFLLCIATFIPIPVTVAS